MRLGAFADCNASGRFRPSRQAAVGVIVLVWGIVSMASATLAVVEAPTNALWMLAVGVTEWGHWVAVLALLPFLFLFVEPRLPWPGRVGLCLCVLAAGLALTPLWRAIAVARQLPDQLSAAFGDAVAGDDAGRSAAPLLPIKLVQTSPANPVRAVGLVYANREGLDLRLDLYQPPSRERETPDVRGQPDAPQMPRAPPRPVVVVIHGGSWRSGDSTQLAALNGYLAARGYAVAAINYRLAPRWTFPAAAEDVNAAIDFLQANAARLDLDGERLVLLGRSAGGQLALLVAYTRLDPAIRGAVAFYAPTDLPYSYRHPADPAVFDSRGTLEAYLGGTPDQAPAAYESASPVSFVDRHTVPTLLVHGGRDELVSPVQSERLDAALARTGQRHLLLRLPWATHGCDHNFYGPCGQLSTYAVEWFLTAVTQAQHAR